VITRAARRTGEAPIAVAAPHEDPRARARRVAHAGEALLTLAAGLAAAIPVIAATVNAIDAGWVPVADRGIIATRAHDVFTSHMPLVGQYTLAGEVTGRVTHSLGPMLFWLLAVPAYYDSTVGMTLTMGALNTLSIVGCVALARRRGGRALMALSALAIALMCQSLAAETFHDIWNPSAGLFPFTLLIFLCWSLGCGSYRLLPATVLVASFVVQAHLTYLPPTLGLLAVGVGGLAAGSARRGRAHARERRRRALVWGLATVLVAAACWSATIVGELTEHPGNLTLVVRSATKPKPTLGATVGWHAVVRAVGIAPWWLRTPKSRWQRKYEVRSGPSALATESCIALLAALALVCVLALVRRRRELAALALCALVLCPALAAVAASTPTPRLLSATLGYTLWWGSQAGMAVWLALAWALWLALAWIAGEVWGAVGRRRAAVADIPVSAARAQGQALTSDPTAGRAHRGAALAALVLSLFAVGTTAAVGAAVAARGEPDEHAVTYAPIRAIDARLRKLVAPGGSVLLEGELDGATMPVKPAVRYFLVTRGTRVLAPGSYLRLGSWYELYARPYREAIYLSDVARAPVRGVPLAFAVGFREGTRRRNTVYVWISHKPGR
jgi:hypothetical protein